MNSAVFAVIMPQTEILLSGESVHFFQLSKSLTCFSNNINIKPQDGVNILMNFGSEGDLCA